MRKKALRTLSVVATTGLLCAGAVALSTAPASAAQAPLVPVTPSALEAGRYIVLLEGSPVATYTGGTQNFAPTQPQKGKSLDPRSTASKRYSAHLEQVQEQIATDAGINVEAHLTYTLNGFTADLSAEQAAELDGKKGIAALIPDEILHVDAMQATEFLGLPGTGGVWESLGGIDKAGEGIVVGVVDSGIASGHPSFAGEELGTTAGAAPYLEGNDVVFKKSDGGTFRSPRVSGPGWDLGEYNTKLVGAQFYGDGMAASGFDFSNDYKSPLDGGGHGSHTASTAAGNHDIDATVLGRDFGAISGVAPAAKVAMYKACWEGPDETSTDDDGCSLTDTMQAINQATADGVDVINYSIGGGAAESTLQVEDVAFFNAAAAGIFVAVSAGNAGPDSSTLDHASPWYTTVGASTFPSYEGTVTLGDGQKFVGASISVVPDKPVTAGLVYAGDIPAEGATAEDAALCLPNTISSAATGKIVICDRGGNARADKSANVKTAGGVGVVLINPSYNSLDNDAHVLPTVHLRAEARDAVLAYSRSTPYAKATLTEGNLLGEEYPTPVVAGFSSRGPVLADGSDILKPDLVAPGVSVLAASKTLPGEAAAFEVMSGTSMASPNVAGLGALYLGAKPQATPAEVKSAMMTTAYGTINDRDEGPVDVFAEGAGHVDAARMFSPGLVFLNGPDDWKAFLAGKGLGNFDNVTPIDGSDLNLASIAVGALTGTQKITRTVTSLEGGTYTFGGEAAGLEIGVSPASVTLAAGESAKVEVTITNKTAAPSKWTQGHLSWTNGEGTKFTAPIAVQPTLIDAPPLVTGEGLSGSASYDAVPGTADPIALTATGLFAQELYVQEGDPVPGHTGNEASGDEDKNVTFIETVAEGTSFARFDLDSSDDTGSDLDLVVYRVVSPTDLRYYERWLSATASADESVMIDKPTAGTYVVQANVYSATAPMTWDLTRTLAKPGAEATTSFSVAPPTVTGAAGVKTAITASWEGLKAGTRAWGIVRYEGSSSTTLVRVDAGEAPVVTPKAELSATARCLGGKVNIALKVTNTDTVSETVLLDSTFGTKEVKNVKPGKNASATFTTKKSAISETAVSAVVTATIEGAVATTTVKASVPALSCG